jgi:hypothetical protein
VTFDECLERLSQAIDRAVSCDQHWLEKVRAGLVALLGFFDDEPGCGRLLLLDGLSAGVSDELECSYRLRSVLAALLAQAQDESSDPARVEPIVDEQPKLGPALACELVAGGVFSVIRTRMLACEEEPLVELAPALMSFIAASCLGLTGAAEIASAGAPAELGNESSLSAIAAGPGRRPIRATYRTACVLRAISSGPGSSNREVAQAAGLSDEGQTSKLLGRLVQRGLIENVGLGAACGEPNAWLLTADGRRVVVELNRDGLLPGASHRTLRRSGAQTLRRPR